MVVVTIGIEVIKNLLADHSFHFPRRHFSVQGIRDNDVDVIDAVSRQHVQHKFERRLANIRGGHRRQGETDVVDSNGYFHAWLKLGEERIAAERMIQRVANRGFTIRQTLHGRIRINDTRADRDRTQAIDAAEAGIDSGVSTIQTSTPTAS